MLSETDNAKPSTNRPDSIDQPVEPADSTAALTEAAKRAESLAAELRALVAGNGFAAALNDIGRIQEIVPLLEQQHREHLASHLGDAAGNAATHAWVATASRIECSACHCTASPTDLRYGRTPVCGDACPKVVHHLMPVWDGKEFGPDGRSRCIYCHGVFPSTAPEGGAR